MKFRKTLLCGVAAAALGITAALPSSPLPELVPAAQAQVQASVSIGTFYDQLSPHGDWVLFEDRHVWVPTAVEATWRPYTVGHWTYARPHGWIWVSDEPFGWAVYHYGRWGFSPVIGWYWVPATQWGPAWVSWRASGDHLAWAPLPPAAGFAPDVDVELIPARYWIAVPATRFLATNVAQVAIAPWEPDFYDVVRHTRYVGHVQIEQDIVINNVINVDYIEEVSGENVDIRQVNYVDDVSEASVADDTVNVFAPQVEEDPDAAPQQVKTAEEVSQERELPEEIAAEELDQPIEVAEDAPPLPQEAVVEEQRPVTEEDVAAEEAEDRSAEGERPEGEPEAAEGERPEGEPEATQGEQRQEAAPEAAEREQPAERQQREAPAAAAEPETGPQVEERAIGEPAGPGQGQGQAPQPQARPEPQPQAQPGQRGRGREEDEQPQ